MKTHDSHIFWWFKALRICMCRQDLPRDGVVPAMIAILHILACQLVVDWLLVSVWTLRPATTIAFGKEGAHMWSIAFVIRVRSCQLLQHLLACRRRAT